MPLDDPRRLTEILNRIRSTYGVYACYGNHDAGGADFGRLYICQ